MKVIFLQNISGVAKIGDIKDVSDGHARNFLLPKKLAVVATSEAIRAIENQINSKLIKKEKTKNNIDEISKKFKSKPLVFKLKADKKTGTVFGSIGSKDIADKFLEILGERIDVKKIKINKPVKTLGDHQVEVSVLGQKITLGIKVETL